MSLYGHEKVNLSVSTCFDYDVPIEQQIPLVARAGFSQLSIGWRESHSGYSSQPRRQLLRRLTADFGLGIDTLHGPIALAPDGLEQIHVAIEAAADLFCPVVVIHASEFEIEDSEVDQSLSRLLSLCESFAATARDLEIRIAIENYVLVLRPNWS